MAARGEEDTVSANGPEIQILTHAECLQRLERGGVGRIALSGAGAPILRPVNFVLHGDQVLIRTGEGTILTSAERGDPASFEIDGIDALEHTGWSVVVVGKLANYHEDREGSAPPLRAWASGVKERLVVVHIDELSGLRIPPGRGNR
jgi:nitroimidazol reductase NimA-like FMN-containing flavoprotein (pyridoxamine 5'-phosphate oxidase superfamily)